MTLDQYQLCPCGSGKKIKFCCSRELIHDLDRVQRMIQGDQRLAALEKINGLLAKYPDRPSLLMTKAEVEMSSDDPSKSREAVERLLAVDPTNPSALAMQALLSITIDGNLNDALNLIQDAFEAADSVVTARMYEAVVVMADVLLRSGLPAASKGHLQLAIALSDAKDERSAKSLMQLNHARKIPLILREPLGMHPSPENVTWKIEFDSAMNSIFRGRWRSGAAQLSAMSARILDAPAILFNQAVVKAWLGDNLNAVKALKEFARIREVPMDDRVHALAIAECLDPDPTKNSVEVVERTHEIQQIEPVMEKCLSDKRLRQAPINPDAETGDEPLPRAFFELLDKQQLAEYENVEAADIPASIGSILVFGKQTDRQARIVLQYARSHEDKVLEFCHGLVDEPLGDPMSEQVVSRLPWLSVEVAKPWRIPEQIQVDERRRLNVELRRHALMERWSTIPSPLLDGKTPTEAVGDGQQKITVLASLLNLETAGQDGHWDLDFNELRKRLGLPEREPIDAATVDLERLPVHRLTQINVQELSDDQLLTVYRRTYAVMAVWPLRKAALEVAARKSLDDKVDKVEAYDILSDVAPTTDEALDYLSKARRLATAEGESPAAWLIDELEIRLLRGEGDKFVQLLKEIQARYIKEPGIAPSLVEVLSRYGMVTPDGRVVVPGQPDAPVEQPQQTAVASTGVWTPDGGTTPATTPVDSEKEPQESKIWIPGMD